MDNKLFDFKNMDKNKLIRLILIVVLSIIIVVCAVLIISRLIAYNKDEQRYQDARDQYQKEVTSSESETEPEETESASEEDPPSISYYLKKDYSDHEKEQPLQLWQVDFSYIIVPKYEFDFEALLELNEDVIGWIKIMDTHVDYPVVQSHDNLEYIRMSIDKTSAGANAGSIFSDCRTSRPFTGTNTILYGHNQHNGRMFHDIIKYDDQDFADRHPLIYIYLPNGKYQVWQVFSSYYTDCYSDTYTLSFKTNKIFGEYVEMLNENSTTSYDIKATKENRILTLSTCADNYLEDYGNMRYVVNAIYLYSDEY